MAYRRTKQKAVEARHWQEFYNQNWQLANAAGVPESIIAQQELFDDLLMHGCIDHHEDPTRFCVDRLSEVQRAKLRDLVFAYFDAGFLDPGVVVVAPGDLETLRQRFPKQFAYRSCGRAASDGWIPPTYD